MNKNKIIKKGMVSLGPLFLIMLCFCCNNLSAIPACTCHINPVSVTDEGNQGDPAANHWGAVNYFFEIGKNDVTVQEYTNFLNAVAKKDLYGLYDSRMNGPRVKLIQRNKADDGNYSYKPVRGKEYYPIVFVNYLSAQRYCNWLQNGALTAEELAEITETGSYELNGATTKIVPVNSEAIYRLPTNNEYHKVTYYKGGGLEAGYYIYPTQSNKILDARTNIRTAPHVANYGLYWTIGYGKNELHPAGAYLKAAGSYGTLDDACNVAQWTSTTNDQGTMLMVRGADWDYWGHHTGIFKESHYLLSSTFRLQLPNQADEHVGFRVVAALPPLNPNTPEFQTARKAYMEANKKYCRANSEYLAAYYMIYNGIQDKYLPIILKQKENGDQLFQAYQEHGRESREYLEAKAQYDKDQEPTNHIWNTHLYSIDYMQDAVKKRDQAEVEYDAARAQYLKSSTQMGHAEDQYDQAINQYDEATKQYIAVASPFLAIEAKWGQDLAEYAESHEVIATGREIDRDREAYFKVSTEKVLEDQPQYEKMLQQFKEAQEQYSKFQCICCPIYSY